MSDIDSNMNDAQKNSDNILESEVDSQASDQMSRGNTRKTKEHPVPAAAIPINALLAL